MNKKKKLAVFKPIDAYDKIDKFWDFSVISLVITGIFTMLAFCTFGIVSITVHNQDNWSVYFLIACLSILCCAGIMSVIAEKLYDAKYNSIGRQIKNGINYWEELSKLLETSDGNKQEIKTT